MALDTPELKTDAQGTSMYPLDPVPPMRRDEADRTRRKGGEPGDPPTPRATRAELRHSVAKLALPWLGLAVAAGLIVFALRYPPTSLADLGRTMLVALTAWLLCVALAIYIAPLALPFIRSRRKG